MESDIKDTAEMHKLVQIKFNLSIEVTVAPGTCQRDERKSKYNLRFFYSIYYSSIA